MALLAGGCQGAAVVRGTDVVAYVAASVGERGPYGRSAWVPRAGHAAADAEALRDAYAAAAETWVEAGAERHYALVPSLARDLEPWYGLAFARMHVEAVRETGSAPAALTAGVRIRPGGSGDVDAVAVPVNDLITDLQARSPSFARAGSASAAEWHETLAEPGAAYFVAERDGEPLGHALLYPADPELGVPADAVYLASTAVVPGARGAGSGSRSPHTCSPGLAPPATAASSPAGA
jgi:hypothetical protein